MRRLVWTALAMTVSATAAGLAVRALDRLWQRVTGEPPPPIATWARLLGARLVRRPISQRLYPGVA